MGLLASPTSLYLIGLGIWAIVGSGAPAAAGGLDVPPDIMARFEAVGTGGVGDAFIGNLLFLVGSTAMAIAVAIIAVQIPFSRWWLTHYAYGPMEWVWRRLTYGQSLPQRRA